MTATVGDGEVKGKKRLSPKFILGTIEVDAVLLMEQWAKNGEKRAKDILRAEFRFMEKQFVRIAEGIWENIKSGKVTRRSR